MATLQDIADAVGVSKVTVSKVLRGKVKGSWPASAARVEAIRRVAAEMDYHADWRAVALQTGRTNVIGLLSTERPETETHDPHLLAGLTEAFGAAGYHVQFYRVRADRHGAGYHDARFDGVVIDYHIEPEELDLIRRSGLPAVIVNAPAEPGIAAVMPDHEAAGRSATEHLIGLGHRRIAFLQSPPTEERDWPQHMNRLWWRGIVSAMADAGLAGGVDEVSFAVQDVYGSDLGQVDVLARLLARPDRPTAVVANQPERTAEQVLLPLARLGLRCPDDLSIVSMGDARGLLWTTPPVTAVNIPFRELGRAAAAELLRQIDARTADARTADARPAGNRPTDARPADADLRCTLVARGSTGPPTLPSPR